MDGFPLPGDDLVTQLNYANTFVVLCGATGGAAARESPHGRIARAIVLQPHK